MQTLLYQLSAAIHLSFLKAKNLQMTACQCSQGYSSPDRMNCGRQLQTMLASNESGRERFCFFIIIILILLLVVMVTGLSGVQFGL